MARCVSLRFYGGAVLWSVLVCALALGCGRKKEGDTYLVVPDVRFRLPPASNMGGDANVPEGSGGEVSAGGTGGEEGGTGGNDPVGEDNDGDGFLAPPHGDDCDDTRREVFPGAIEVVLNGIDENCDGSDLIGELQSRSVLPEEAVLGEAPDLAWANVDGEPHLLMVWTDSRVAPRQDVYGQLLDLEGNPVGDEIAIDDVDNNAKAGVRIVSKGDGYLVVWATAEGIFAQQLHADGTKRGVLFGLDDAGGQKPVPAYGAEETNLGGAWAVAWTRPGDDPGSQAMLRGMSIDTEAIRAPVQTLGGVTDTISAVALAGYDEGFVVSWEGPLGDGRGIVGRDASRTAQLRGEAFEIFRGTANAPAMIWTGEEFFTVFRSAGPLSYAGAQIFSTVGEVMDPEAVVRLSGESFSQSAFRLAVGSLGVFSLWNDGRHLGHNPTVQSVYGNHSNSGAPEWSMGRAFYATSAVEMGGVAVVDDVAYVVVHANDDARLFSHVME